MGLIEFIGVLGPFRGNAIFNTGIAINAMALPNARHLGFYGLLVRVVLWQNDAHLVFESGVGTDGRW